MKIDNDKTIFISQSSPFGIGIPCVQIPAYMNDWPCVEATNSVLLTIQKLIHLGFRGVKIEKSSAPGDKKGEQSDRVIMADLSTPEGRVLQGIMHFASFGQPTDVNLNIDLVEEMYVSEGLKLPYKKGAQE